jgi:hypothetical protein
MGGLRLLLLRTAFVILSLPTVIFFGMGLPLYLQNYIHNLDSETLSALTGKKKPFERNNTWAMIRFHLEEPPPTHVPLPEHVAGAILRALAKEPEERFPSIGEFVIVLSKSG